MPVSQNEDLELFFLTECRHDIQLAPINPDPQYEEAFFPKGEDDICEYALNTTAWD